MGMEGRIAIVTGGGRGIGRAIVEAFAKRGAQIVLGDRNVEQAEITAQEISAATGQHVTACEVDVSDHQSAKSMIDCALSKFGKIDILVNNAGVTRDMLIMRMDEADWDTVLNINLKGAFNCSKAVIRPMMKQRYGRIVNISSVSALAREVASRGITVNAVAPGFIPTALTVDLPQDLKDSILQATPMGRMGTPEEVAHAVTFFASEEASYITGQVLSVDGGMVMM
jgi:3-oxoacyl-[acyl-carrier protein] reductase